MAEKKGFLYYLEHPEEIAKKALPFIDVDAMMQSNKERYEALGVDPEMGKNLMGFALNPVAVGTAKVAGGLFSGISSGIKKLRDINYLRKSRNLLSKELLSPQSFDRYKRSHINEINNALNQLRGRPGAAKSREFLKKRRAYAKTDKGFKDFYLQVVKDRIKNIPVSFLQSGDKYAGAYRTSDWSARGNKLRPFRFGNITFPEYPGSPVALPTSKVGREIFKDLTKEGKKGRIELVRQHIYNWRTRRFNSTGVHELKHGVQDPLKAYEYTAKRLIPTTKIEGINMPKIVAEGKAKDLAGIPLPKHLSKSWKNWSDYNKYLTGSDEISSRFSEWRLLPSSDRKKILSGLIKKKGKYLLRNKNVEHLPDSFKDLMKVYKTKARFLKAERDVWGVVPIGAMDYSKKK